MGRQFHNGKHGILLSCHRFLCISQVEVMFSVAFFPLIFFDDTLKGFAMNGFGILLFDFWSKDLYEEWVQFNEINASSFCEVVNALC
jgi:hypothetical protein